MAAITRTKAKVAAAGVGGLALVGAAQAQQATIKRTVRQRGDGPGSSYEVVRGLAKLPAAVLIGKHIHPGTLVEGELTVMVQGQPDAVFKPGQSWMIPAGTPHDAKAGPGGAKVIAVYSVQKGKPLASAAN
jgi:quercetin dioxygenase-like cupin family protein